MLNKQTCGRILRLFVVLAFTLSVILSLSAVQAASYTIVNDSFWKDTSGNPIYSQGGGIFKFNGTYYWYGVKYNGAVTYYNNPTAKNSDTSFNAVTCYSSSDLVNWKFENNILTASTPGLEGCTWLGRLGVAYNTTTQKYVLVTQFVGNNGSGILFATCSTPTGNYTYNRVQTSITNVVNGMSGDQTIFTDDDGKSYLVFSNTSGRAYTYVAPLRTSDYLNVEPATQIYHSTSGGREGNCMFKYNGRYYVCSSDLHGWNASQCYYISSTSILGSYSSEGVMTNSDKDFCHVSQTGFFVTVSGTSGTTVLFCGDRWCDFAGNGAGYNQWCPVTFSGTTPIFNSYSNWNLDAAAGTWSVAGGNNYVLNPTFEADRVSQNALAGWSTWDNLSSADPNSNDSDHYGSGRWCMAQSYTSAYSASRYQNVTGLPNGTYTLKAWVKSSGGQGVCRMFVKNYGGSELQSSFNTAISNWTQITISNINVTNGQCQIGIYQEANANNWCRADGFTLTRN
jgi:hypothetical protein